MYLCFEYIDTLHSFPLVLLMYLPITMEENQHEKDSYKKKRRCG